EDLGSELRIDLIEPASEADAAGDRIEFSDTDAVLGEEQIRPDHAGNFVFENRRALQLDKFSRFALVEPTGDPFRLFPFGAFAIEQIDRTIELKQHTTKSFEIFGEFCAESERDGRHAPGMPGKKTLRRQSVAYRVGDIAR